MGNRLLYILVFADIQKIHAGANMIIRQLIREVEQVTERLTEKSENGFYIVDKHKASIFMYNKYFAGQAINKLAEYETAEEEGRLVILPCKIGTRVYEIYQFCGCGAWEIEEHKIKLEDLDKIGKTVFLTREEAEKALRDRMDFHI